MMGGGLGNNVVFSAKSETRSVADMMISRRGYSTRLASGATKFVRPHLYALSLLRPHLLAKLDYSAENSDEDVGVHTPLMSFVNDDN